MSSAETLFPRFDALWNRMVRPGGSSQAWKKLDARYATPARAYHGWTHIAAMLPDLDAAKTEPNFDGVRFEAVELAVFFHDAIYDPRRSDNEAASAELFAEEAGMQAVLGLEGIEYVRDMILATAAHGPSRDASTRLLLDFDLAVLGALPARYDLYVEGIRREYAHVSDAAWRLGRGSVLKRFLERESIFQTSRRPCENRRWRVVAR